MRLCKHGKGALLLKWLLSCLVSKGKCDQIHCSFNISSSIGCTFGFSKADYKENMAGGNKYICCFWGGTLWYLEGFLKCRPNINKLFFLNIRSFEILWFEGFTTWDICDLFYATSYKSSYFFATLTRQRCSLLSRKLLQLSVLLAWRFFV